MTSIASPEFNAVAGRVAATSATPGVIYRRMGDRYLLVEYGDIVLDVKLRIRVHSLQQALRDSRIPGVEETNPGVRSLLIQYNPDRIGHQNLVALLDDMEGKLPADNTVEVSSRRVVLPMAFNDRWCREAVKMYSESVRAEAPYIPDNVEFVARCNGLDSVDTVGEYLRRSEVLVIGLGDVYLGAPCAVPLDPRYRMSAPKYNPARTFTPEGAVGIGGAAMCIYPMESPGGYQLVGRTLPIWNTAQKGAAFKDAPWLLRNFDRIVFEFVSETELESLRERFFNGDYPLRIEDGVFRIGEYEKFVASVQDEIDVFHRQQEKAIVAATVGY